MSIAFEDQHLKVHQGHVLDVLPEIPYGSIQCCVTSPPYLGLRSYLPVVELHPAYIPLIKKRTFITPGLMLK